MFIKIVIILLLLIVVASLLSNRLPGSPQDGRPQVRPADRIRPLMLRVAMVLLGIGAIALVLHLTGCSKPDNAFYATEVKNADFGCLAALDGLTDHTGRRLVSADFSGKAVVVFFGYTHCPDICPTALAAMKEAMARLGAEAERVQVLFVTVDPERDTQEILAGYVPWFDSRFLGLRGDTQATLAAAREFHVFFSKAKASTALDYTIDHSATSFAFDPQGRLRLLMPNGAQPAHIAADMQRLLVSQGPK